MSGYDFIKANPTLQLLKTNKVVYKDLDEINSNNINGYNKPKYYLDGLKSQEMRFKHNGGIHQDERMVFDKRRSLDRALLYSYQRAFIKKAQCNDGLDNSERPNIIALNEHEVCRALINPDKNKRDYDDKIISVHYEENYHSGDVFEWLGTHTYWLIYLQDLTETAYFRGEIRKCSYEIEWEDEDGKHSTFAAIRGPVETKIDYIQKHKISVDNPNYSLNMLLPRTKESVAFFKRYSKFYLQEDTEKVCWRVEAADWISTPGILEVTATEYYANESEDDIENGIVGGLKVKKINPNDIQAEEMIQGETFIKPNQVYEYYYNGILGSWSIVEKCPAIFNVDPENPRHIKLKWDGSFSGQFTLQHGKHTKTIVVESLF